MFNIFKNLFAMNEEKTQNEPIETTSNNEEIKESIKNETSAKIEENDADKIPTKLSTFALNKEGFINLVYLSLDRNLNGLKVTLRTKEGKYFETNAKEVVNELRNLQIGTCYNFSYSDSLNKWILKRIKVNQL